MRMHSRAQERGTSRCRMVRMSLILHNFSRYYQLWTLLTAAREIRCCAGNGCCRPVLN